MIPTTIDKDRPTSDWMAEISRRFPVEREVDRVLRRKLGMRSGPPFSGAGLDRLVAGVEALIAARHQGAFSIADAHWLTGGASKLQMAFTLQWTPPGGSPGRTKLVLRMEPAASVCETSRLREHQMLEMFEGLVPVPKAYWVDAAGEFLPYPALVYGFSEGVTKPSHSVSNVTGLGTNLGPDLRRQLAPHFLSQLATIHRAPIDAPGLTAFDRPDSPTRAAEWALNWWERVWEEDAGEEVPLMRLAAGWMRGNLPKADRLSVVHADFRTGNFLFDEKDAKITAWLDWELAHIGDRHEDLAWSMSPAFGHFAEEGTEFLTCGLLSEAEFLGGYEAASGLPVIPATLHFYRVLAAYKAIVIVLGAGFRNARNGKSHQDVLLVWLMGLAYPLLEELRSRLEEAF